MITFVENSAPGAPSSLIPRLGRWAYALILATLGLCLAGFGAYLAFLGGSPYYVVQGAILVLVAVLLALRRWRAAGCAYALLLAATTVWCVYEVGFDAWAWVPRLAMYAVLGLPFVVRPCAGVPVRRKTGLALLAALTVAVAVSALMPMGSSPARPVSPYRLADERTGEWPDFSNGNAGTRHSPLGQITQGNVGDLAVAWTRPIEMPASNVGARFETVPLKVGDSLYFCSSFNDVYSVDAETGQVRWHFEAEVNKAGVTYAICRGVTYYRVPSAVGVCAERIYTNTIDARLVALDAETGKPCKEFGENGEVDLFHKLGERKPGYYFPSSAPTLARGNLVLGGFVADGQHVNEPSGVVRAFDAVTGQLAWAWDMGRPGYNLEPEDGKTYTPGTPNAWAPMSTDESLGLVFVPTGNSTPDYWGGHRSPESNRYASSVVALDVATGEPRWSFQTTHYDVWDYDVGSQPVLVDIDLPAGRVPALVQPTKRGELFVLDRRNGRPIFPVVEKAAPQRGGVERMSATQPASIAMPNFGGPRLVEADVWGVTPLDQLWCRIRFKEARYDGPMTPPGLTSSIADPGYIGGMNWGSTTVDPTRQVAVIVSHRLVNYIRLLPRAEADMRGLQPAVGEGIDLGGAVAQAGTPYGASIAPFLSPLGTPCQRPPYGLINGVDLRTGKLLWSRPLGNARDLGPLGLRSHLPLTIGTPTIGGPMSTETGLSFVAASQDRKLRAFDTQTGRLLWSTDLPFTSQAVPMSYYSEQSGRQFIVLATGDGTVIDGIRRGALVAYALPSAR